MVRTLFSINIIAFTTIVFGFLNSLLIAKFFGLTTLLDSYYAAITIPTLAMSLFIDFMGKNFLPAYGKLKTRSDSEASEYASSMVNIVFFLSILLVGAIMFFSEKLLTLILPGFDHEKILLTTKMFLLVGPSLVFMAVNTFHEYIWQYEEKYIGIVMTKSLLSLSILCSMLLFRKILNEYALAVGYIAGTFLRFVILFIGSNYNYRLLLVKNSKYIKRTLNNSGMLMTSGTIARIRPAIEKYFGSMLENGAISALSMAGRICSPIYQSAFVGVRMISFTKSSKIFADGRIEEFGKLYTSTVSAILLVSIPVVSWVVINSDNVVHLLFLHGNFDKNMQMMLSSALIGLVPATIFMSVAQVVSNAYYVINKIIIPVIVGPLSTCIYIVSLLILKKDGVFGLAAANSIMHFLSFILMTFFLNKYIPSFDVLSIWKKFSWYLCLSVIPAILCKIILLHYGTSALISIIVSLIVVGATYLCVLYICNDKIFTLVRCLIFNNKTIK